jgi:ribosomal protein S18 acetylase RimI-like enzyme
MVLPKGSVMPEQCADWESDSRSIKVRAASREEVNEIVELHIASFQGFFLTRLGARFLRELYRGFVQETAGICLVAAERGGGIVGVVAGTIAPGRFFRDLLFHRGIRFAMAAVPAVVQDPRFFARRLIGALLYRGDTPQGLDGAALLSSLAVRPNVSGRGIGGCLVDAFSSCANSAGASAVFLTTDACENDRVNAFYVKLGFIVFEKLVRRDGRVLNVYCRPSGGTRQAGKSG